MVCKCFLHFSFQTERFTPWLQHGGVCRAIGARPGRKIPFPGFEALGGRGSSGCAGSRTPCPRCWFLQGYLWDNNQVVVEWLEKHMQEEDGTQSAIRENIKYLKRDYILKHIRR